MKSIKVNISNGKIFRWYMKSPKMLIETGYGWAGKSNFRNIDLRSCQDFISEN